MLFNSPTYVWFLPVVVVVYWMLRHRYRWALLLIASYYFYGSWDPRFLSLIVLSTMVDYVAALRMAATESDSGKKRWLWFSLLVNLSVLGVFKYANFFVDSAIVALDASGLSVPDFYVRIGVPVGISFYTFQTLSYTIDVYRGRLQPERHLGRFAVYVAFFPQLVAGPIERATSLLPQFVTRARIGLEDVQHGINRIAYGFFKKIVVADHLAVYVGNVFNDVAQAQALSIAIGTVFFAIQVYCDFSGYSDIAIGSARLFGIRLMNNFDRPYLVHSLRGYWRKWHISLSTWVRDYVYIPLGGSRSGLWQTAFNLVLSFTLVGLWHGPRWTYVLFGFCHGSYMTLERLARKRSEHLPVLLRNMVSTPLALTFIVGSLLLFCVETLPEARIAYGRLLVGPWRFTAKAFTGGLNHYDFKICLAVIGLLALSYLLPRKLHFKGRYGWLKNLFVAAVFIVLAITLNYNGQLEFFYFQF